MDDKNKIVELLNGKRVLFVTTKNIEYIRISQEIKLIKQNSKQHKIIGINSKRYLIRILYVYLSLLLENLKEYDIIFVGFMPQLVIPILAFKFRKKVVMIDFFISVYDTLVWDRKKFRDGYMIARICRLIDTITLKRAEYVITDTYSHAHYFAREFNARKPIYLNLYLEADKNIFYKRNVEKPKELKDKFIVLYFGSILPLQGIDVILEAIEELREYKDMHFMIIGPVPDDKKKYNNEQIEYIPWLPQEQLASCIAYADLCLAGHFSSDIDKAKRTIPGKAYIYKNMGKKVIFGDSPANHELFIDDEKENFYVEMGNPKKLAQKIVLVYSQSRKENVE